MKTRYYLMDPETLEVLDACLKFTREEAFDWLTDGYQPGDPVEVLSHPEYLDRVLDTVTFALTEVAGRGHQRQAGLAG